MSINKLFSFYDRSVSLVLVAMGVILAGATAVVGA
jgi:hypothetical protein